MIVFFRLSTLVQLSLGDIMATVMNDELSIGIVEHTTALGRYARFLMRSSDEADDLVQDCITRALSRPHLYRPDSNLRAWLFAIMHNIFMTQSRRAAYRRRYAVQQMATEARTTSPNQFHVVALKESLQLMEQLPALEQQALALLGIFDLSYRAAAEQFGVKIGTMKSRMNRARAHLRLLAAPESYTAGTVPVRSFACSTAAM